VNYQKPRFVAEVGCNHKGQMDIAREFIQTAAVYCKVDIVKFQKRNIHELLSAEAYHAPHPDPANAYGRTYGEHREYLEFDLEQHRQLKDWCQEYGLVYSSSVWDLGSAKAIVSLDPKQIKIPSAGNNHQTMLKYLCDHFPGEIHVSLGMTTRAEEEALVKLFEAKRRNQDLVIYSCTSGYPVSFEDVCLLEIMRLKETYGSIVKEIGFSGHHLGIAVDIAAYTLGVTIIERHFTLNRTWKGTDHAASLEPDGLRKLVRDVNAAYKALSYKTKEILDIEMIQREKLKNRYVNN
jgi:sialic acid synthase